MCIIATFLFYDGVMKDFDKNYMMGGILVLSFGASAIVVSGVTVNEGFMKNPRIKMEEEGQNGDLLI